MSSDRFSYKSEGWDPPAPVLPIGLAADANGAHQIFDALFDSGADVSVVPPHVVERLSLAGGSHIRFSAFTDGVKVESTAVVYQVHVELPGRVGRGNLQVMEHQFGPDQQYVVLGRDLMNLWRITLDGPDLSFEIST